MAVFSVVTTCILPDVCPPKKITVLKGEQNVKILMRGLFFYYKQQCTTNHAILIPVQLEYTRRSAENN
jgi:hypothetical protein